MARIGRTPFASMIERVRDKPVAIGAAIVALVVIAVGVSRIVSPSHAFVIGSEAADSGVPTLEQVEGGGGEPFHEETAVFVHVSGAVVEPGLYELADGARVAEAIDAAGGLSEDAVPDAVNLARLVFDGEQIIVPSVTDEASQPGDHANTLSIANGKVNINTADAAELDTITGVGPSTAEKIVTDREQYGPFATIEDLKRVSGIGDKKFEAMRDEICV